MAQSPTSRGANFAVVNSGTSVKSGDLVAIGALKGWAIFDIPSGEKGTLAKFNTDVQLKKTGNSVAIAVGDVVYGLHGTKTCNKTSASRVRLGVAYTASPANSSDPVWVQLQMQ